MSDRDVLDILDRVETALPAMSVSRERVQERGETLVRRRRTVAVGSLAAGLAVVLAVVLGGTRGLLGAAEVTPASVAWEVAGPARVELHPDGALWVGNLHPETLETVDGVTRATWSRLGTSGTETVTGRMIAGGAQLFQGRTGTLVVWRQPTEAGDSATLAPQRLADGVTGMTRARVGGQELMVFGTDQAGFTPKDIVFHDDTHVWTAGGEVGSTAWLDDGRASVQVYSLPGLGEAGVVLGEPQPFSPGGMSSSGGTEPWWRGGDRYEWYVAQVPIEATRARLAWSSDAGTLVDPGPSVEVTRLGGTAFVLFSIPEDQRIARTELAAAYQWSSDGSTWHDQPRP